MAQPSQILISGTNLEIFLIENSVKVKIFPKSEPVENLDKFSQLQISLNSSNLNSLEPRENLTETQEDVKSAGEIKQDFGNWKSDFTKMIHKRMYHNKNRITWKLDNPKYPNILEKLKINNSPVYQCPGYTVVTSGNNMKCRSKRIVDLRNKDDYSDFELDHEIPIVTINFLCNEIYLAIALKLLDKTYGIISNKLEKSISSLPKFPRGRTFGEIPDVKLGRLADMVWDFLTNLPKNLDETEYFTKEDIAKINNIMEKEINKELYLDDVYGSNIKFKCANCHSRRRGHYLKYKDLNMRYLLNISHVIATPL